MNIFRDKQIKHFSLFIAIYSILLVGVSTWFSINQLNTAKSMYLEHDRAIVSALLEQEVSKEVIANAISSTDISTAGMEFLDNLGITTNTFGSLLPHFSQFQYHFLRIALGGGICLVIILVIGVISFLQIRNNPQFTWIGRTPLSFTETIIRRTATTSSDWESFDNTAKTNFSR